MSECICMSGRWFPYYIVRFKLAMHSFSYYFFHVFPYYIVRFKLCEKIQTVKCRQCFHTTQYDLNKICLITSKNIMMFPYYIVRFKLPHTLTAFARQNSFHTTQYDLNHTGHMPHHPDMHSFHTTQYDLNCSWKFCATACFFVSILHSTI